MDKWITTEYPQINFEDSEIGRLKKEIFEMPFDEVVRVLKEDFDIPNANECEIGVAGSYIQNTPRNKVIEKRRKNDIVLVPVGCTENHGIHNPSGLDTYMCTALCEAVRRYTKKMGYEVSVALPVLNYGGHPYHHIGMPGTVIMSEEVVRETIVYTLAGLWDDGFRKIILVNNHGHKWMLEAGVQEFFKRFQVPAIVSELEWHRAIREFWVPTDREHSLTTHFIHADEAETAVANLLFPSMVDMSVCVDAQAVPLTLRNHYDTSVDSMQRPHTWSEGEGQSMIERFGTPEGVVGYPSRGSADKAMRPVLAACKYIVKMIDDILADYPAGTVPVDGFTFRDRDEVEACLKEPQSEGWKSIHEIKKIGIF